MSRYDSMGRRFANSANKWYRDAKSRRTNSFPLRKIVEEFYENGQDKERLECGHVVRRREDIIGATNAYRRRCRQCADAMKEGETP